MILVGSFGMISRGM